MVPFISSQWQLSSLPIVFGVVVSSGASFHVHHMDAEQAPGQARRHSPCRDECRAQFRSFSRTHWHHRLGSEESRSCGRREKSTCGQVASDNETSVKAFAEELNVLADATQVCQDETGGAKEHMYSLVQESSASGSQTTMDLKRRTSGDNVKDVSPEEHSAALSQLASRISAVMKFGAGARPFAKVKGLITELTNRLQSEASSEAYRKSYCVEETSKATEEK